VYEIGREKKGRLVKHRFKYIQFLTSHTQIASVVSSSFFVLKNEEKMFVWKEEEQLVEKQHPMIDDKAFRCLNVLDIAHWRASKKYKEAP
jgi:hypothetical protein